MRRPRGRGWMRLSGSNRKKISSKGKREKEKKDSRVFSWTTGQIEGGHQGTRRTLFSSVGVQGLEARWHSRVICWTFNLFFTLKKLQQAFPTRSRSLTQIRGLGETGNHFWYAAKEWTFILGSRGEDSWILGRCYGSIMEGTMVW